MYELILKNNKVVCESDIPKNSPIYEFTGEIYNYMPSYDESLILQIGSNSYMGPSGKIDDLIKHSCNPNCYISIIGKRAILFSLFEIKANTELCFDYSVSSSDNLNFKCTCNSFNCRKIIKSFHNLDENKKNELIKKGIVPLFISDKRFK